MSLPHLVKQIRQLPYSDMMTLAGELASALHKEFNVRADAAVLADIVSKLQSHAQPVIDQSTQEAKIIDELFGKKKRLIAVSPLVTNGRKHGGYSTVISEIPATQAMGTDLRICLNNSLDQAITMHALTRGR